MRIDSIDEKMLFFLKNGPAKRRELEALAPNKRIGKRRVEKFIKNQFITPTKQWGEYELGPNGKAYLNSLSSPPSSFKDSKLIKLIDMLSTEAHRAWMRLTLSGIVAKQLLFNDFDSNWPTSIIIGATKALKTVSLELICSLIKGLDPVRNLFPLYSGTPGELGVRRYKAKGQDAFEISKSRFLREIFAGFQEWKEADPKLKKKILLFIEGKKETEVEGKKVINHAYTAIVTNPETKRPTFADFIIRRSIVLNTEPLRPQLGDVDIVAWKINELFSSGRGLELDIGKLPVISRKLSKRDFMFLRNLFMNNVKEKHKSLVDTAPLQILALGRASLLQSKNIRRAILETVWDRLECLETMDGAKELWRDRLLSAWEREGSIPARIRAQLEKIRKMEEKTTIEKKKVATKEQKRKEESYAFSIRKEKAITRVQEARDKLPLDKEGKKRSSLLRSEANSLIKEIQGIRKEEGFEFYEQKMLEIEDKVTTFLSSYKTVSDKQEKNDASTKLLRSLIEDWIERKKTLAQDNILEKLKSVGCIHARLAQEQACSPFLKIHFIIRGFKKIPSSFLYYEGVDGGVYFPEELDTWDRARPLLVRRLKQLEQGEEDTKFGSDEKRLKDMVDCVLTNPNEWPEWFKEQYGKLVTEKINAVLSNPDTWPEWFKEQHNKSLEKKIKAVLSDDKQWPEWFRAFFLKSVNEKVDQRLNEEFQKRVSIEATHQIELHKAVLSARYSADKVNDLTAKINKNVFKALKGPWSNFFCPKCHHQFVLEVSEEGVKNLIKKGEVRAICPNNHIFSIKLEDLILASF